MNIAIMSELYPSKDNIYSASYVHVRVLEYIKCGHTCIVYKLNKNQNIRYVFENVIVYQGNEKYLKIHMEKNNFEVIVMHAPNPDEKYYVMKYFNSSKVICWMHGLDSVSGAFTYPYSGNFIFHPIRFLFRLKEDYRKIISWRKFIKEKNPRIVVVSNWLKKEASSFIGVKLKNTIRIPNHIDEDIFKFKKREGVIKKIVCIRPHASGKYAIDIAIKAFEDSKYQLDIIGVGKLLHRHRELATKLNSNINFIEKLFPKEELKKEFDKYDLAIMPTRHDTHGVIVCEMLMSGLPVITSEIGMGNSEYKTRGSVFLDNKEFITQNIIDEINSNGKLSEMSLNAHVDMMKLASKKNVIKNELEEIRNL